MEKKNFELEVFTADGIDCQYIEVYKVMEVDGNGNAEYITTYLYKEHAEKETKQLENDNGISTLVLRELVWLN